MPPPAPAPRPPAPTLERNARALIAPVPEKLDESEAQPEVRP